jgi:hypothetical protein
MRDAKQVIQGFKSALMMVVVQISLASVNVLYKIATNEGMDVKILTAYRLMLTAASTIPMAIFFKRHT